MTSSEYIKYETTTYDVLANGNKIDPIIGVKIYRCWVENDGKDYKEEYIDSLNKIALELFLRNIEKLENAKQPEL